MEKGQARLEHEIKTTREKLKRVRVDQSIANHSLSKLREQSEARSTALELKVERTSFEMQVHPDAAAALRKFAAETLESTRRDEKIWIFDPGPAAGTA
jgi:hypothetical protein